MFIILILVVVGTLLALIPHVIYIVMKLASLLGKFSVSYKPYGWCALGLFVIWGLMFLYGNKVGRFRSEVKEWEFGRKDVPEAFDGYRIVHISDIHLDGWKGHEEELKDRVEEVNALGADLICFTGDLVSLSSHELDDFVDILKGMKAKDGVVSILGNHDYMPYMHKSNAERQKEVNEVVRIEREVLGWKLLMNENTIIRRGNDSIAIMGCENQSVGAHPVIQRGDLQKTMEGTDGMFRILLTHDPSQWRKEVVGETDIPLTLSGHTHAMQFKVFGFTPSKWAYPECDGWYEEGGQSIYVNIGLGGTMPMRIGATPEITCFTLKRK